MMTNLSRLILSELLGRFHAVEGDKPAGKFVISRAQRKRKEIIARLTNRRYDCVLPSLWKL